MRMLIFGILVGGIVIAASVEYITKPLPPTTYNEAQAAYECEEEYGGDSVMLDLGSNEYICYEGGRDGAELARLRAEQLAG